MLVYQRVTILFSQTRFNQDSPMPGTRRLPTSPILLPWRVGMFQPCRYQRMIINMAYQTCAGWWLTYPSEKYEFVSWDDDIPNIWKVIKLMFQTTNQCVVCQCCLSMLFVNICQLLSHLVCNSNMKHMSNHHSHGRSCSNVLIITSVLFVNCLEFEIYWCFNHKTTTFTTLIPMVAGYPSSISWSETSWVSLCHCASAALRGLPLAPKSAAAKFSGVASWQ